MMETKPQLTTANKQGLPWSVYVLIAANLIPLFGVLFFQWEAQVVLALYWIENLIIGAFNVVKMLSVSAIKKQFQGLLMVAFFIVHYGLFCAGHGMLLTDLLGLEGAVESIEFQYEADGLLSIFQEGLAVFLMFVERLSPAILYGILALLLSRLVSFIEHFILRGELFNTDVNKLMGAPYAQIIIMHVGLILGAMALNYFQSPIWLLAIIVVFKMVLDYTQHKKRHQLTNNH